MKSKVNSSNTHRKSGVLYVPSEWEMHNQQIVGAACTRWLRARGLADRMLNSEQQNVLNGGKGNRSRPKVKHSETGGRERQ